MVLMLQYPNTILNQNPLINLSRSDNKWEFFKVRHLLCRQAAENFSCVCRGVHNRDKCQALHASVAGLVH